eukprot:m.19844 g.19844  ORF g.19844 m.19844 type:complete len:203 (+) comp8507_c1_seq2:36-644(+)
MRLLIVRHGETDWNREKRLQGHIDTDLSDVGIEQAEKAGEYLSNHSFHAVYASDLKRAVNTAKAICSTAGIENEIETTPSFRERHFGVLSGNTIDYCCVHFKDVFQRIKEVDYQLPEGESIRQFRERVAHGLELLASEHKGETVMLVTHGGTVRAILHHVLGDKVGCNLHIKNTSLTEVTWCEENGWNMNFYNAVPHIPPES